MPDEKLRQIFAENLNNYLELNGYSQADLARHMHVSTASTAKWCTGQSIPRIDKIQSICNWLGIEKSDLLEDKHGQKPQYYLDSESMEAAEFLHKNPEYKVLFDATRKVKPEDIEFVREMIDRTTRDE
jgi:transcriptional regulator with XRE-family HTH domain